MEEQERARDPAQRQRAPRAMKRLDLCNNRLGDLGAIVLSEALRDPVGFQGRVSV